MNKYSEADSRFEFAKGVADSLLEQRPLCGRNILIVVENLPVPFDRRVWQEATTLVKAGAAVSVICPTGKGYDKLYEKIEGVDIYRHPLPLDAKGAIGYAIEYSAALYHETRLAIKCFRQKRFDTIHGCNPPDLIFLVSLLFRPFGVQYIFDHHDINPELYEAKYNKKGFFWSLMRVFERASFATARVVISTNESYKKIAIERGKKSPNDIFIVRSGPNIDRLKVKDKNESLKRGKKYLVGYVGVMGEQEGIDILLRAIECIVKVHDRSDIHFCLVGGGPELAAMKRMASDLEISDFVEFTGRAPDDVLFEVLSTSDICVNPDRVNDMNDKSTMNKILEYMAFSKPIVQFDVTEGRYSAAEASLYAQANDFEDFADKILELIDDEAKCRRMGEYGRKRVVSSLSWQHEIPKLIEAYQQAMK